MRGSKRAMWALLLPAALSLGVAFSQEGNGDGPEFAGKEIYSNSCAACHGVGGGGRLGPPLRGNLRLADLRYLVAKVLRGGGGMPGFAGRLKPAEIAAVANHVASSWGNDFGSATLAQVEGQLLGDPKEPEALYRRNCAICHMDGGRGFIGPRLAGNPRLADAEFVVEKIRLGGGGMPAFSGILDPEQVSALAGFVRMSWGNRLGPVSVAQVVERAAGAGKEPAAVDQADAGGSGSIAEAVELYRSTCATCHGDQGSGDVGPRLRGNQDLADVRYLVSRIAMGGDGMPPFNLELSTAQVAALGTLLRTSWDNDLGSVTAQQARRWHSDASEAVELFSNKCAGCHGFAGRGYRGPGPPLARNRNLEDASYLARQIIYGSANMPAFGDELSLEQIAELATYLRTRWGNDYGPVELEVVQGEASGQVGEEPK